MASCLGYVKNCNRQEYPGAFHLGCWPRKSPLGCLIILSVHKIALQRIDGSPTLDALHTVLGFIAMQIPSEASKKACRLNAVNGVLSNGICIDQGRQSFSRVDRARCIPRFSRFFTDDAISDLTLCDISVLTCLFQFCFKR